MEDTLDHLYTLLSSSSVYNVRLINIKRILNQNPDIYRMIEEHMNLVPVALLIFFNVDPYIFKYLYNKWYTSDIIYVHDNTIIPPSITQIEPGKYRISDIVRDSLEKMYTHNYYVCPDNLQCLDIYATICGVEYEKRTPYGPREGI